LGALSGTFFGLKASGYHGGLLIQLSLELTLELVGVHRAWIHVVFQFQLDTHEALIMDHVVPDQLHGVDKTCISLEDVLADERNQIRNLGELGIAGLGELYTLDVHEFFIQ
jgi:hypothetical protein